MPCIFIKTGLDIDILIYPFGLSGWARDTGIAAFWRSHGAKKLIYSPLSVSQFDTCKKDQVSL